MNAFNAWNLTLAILFGAGLAIVLWMIQAAVNLLPLSQRRRQAVAQVVPLLGLVIALVYATVAVPAVFQGEIARATAAAAVLGAVVISGWSTLRDLVSGVFVKVGGSLQLGDGITVGDHRGRVTHIGLRTVELETDDGDQALVPFTELARQTLVRTPAISGSYRHRFTVPAPDEAKLGRAKQIIREVALLSHWSQVARDPEIYFSAGHGEGDRLEVQVYPIDPGRGPDVEASVRRALERAKL